MSDPNAGQNAGKIPASKSRRNEFIRIALLVVVTIILWCVANNRTSLWKWNVPFVYGGDNFLVMGWIKDSMEGHFWPVLPKYNPSLGAPFTANWNDYPVTECTLIFFMGCLAKVFGLFAATNMAVLIEVILAGIAFYCVCRWLRVAWEWAAAGALAFAFSPYIFARSFGHITLTYCWHIPLCILVCWWLASRRGLDCKGRRFWFALAVAFVTGIQNPYYTCLFLQFTGFAFLAQLLRLRSSRHGGTGQTWFRPVMLAQIRGNVRRTLLAPVAVGAVAGAAFLLMNLDTIYYGAVHGKNKEAVDRNYSALELYALKPVDMIVPPVTHAIPIMRKLGESYAGKTLYYEEGAKSGYLGVIGIFALSWLLWISVTKALSRPPQPLPDRMLQIIWITFFSVVGGANCLLGLLGLELFRGTNRFSIWILALLFLFLVQRLNRIGRVWSPARRATIALLLCVLVFVDQVPRIPKDMILEGTQRVMLSDKGLVEKLTQALPPQSMIFQLPVADYPEIPPIGGMADYEHLRPYLFSHNLRYSYGTDKGRETDLWQHETGDLKPAEMIARLEACGFGAIWINLKGYADNGKALIDGLRDAGRAETLESARGDLLCVLLHPSAHPVLPNPLLQFVSGWYPVENATSGSLNGTKMHWSNMDAEVDVVNTSTAPASFRITFDISSPIPRKLTVMNGKTGILETEIGPESKNISNIVVELAPGKTHLVFKTDIPAAQVPGLADQRKLGFLLTNLSMAPQASQ